MNSRQAIPLALATAACAALAGPSTPVADFFARHVDTSSPALSPIPALMGKGDVAGAEKVFADYVRANRQTEKVDREWMTRH